MRREHGLRTAIKPLQLQIASACVSEQPSHALVATLHTFLGAAQERESFHDKNSPNAVLMPFVHLQVSKNVQNAHMQLH